MQLKYQNISYDQNVVNEIWYVYLLTKDLYILQAKILMSLKAHWAIAFTQINVVVVVFFFTSLFSSSGKHKKYSEKFWCPIIVFYVSLVSIVTYFKLTAIYTTWSFNLILEVASYTNSFLKISYSLFYSSFKWWSFFPTSDEVFSF